MTEILNFTELSVQAKRDHITNIVQTLSGEYDILLFQITDYQNLVTIYNSNAMQELSEQFLLRIKEEISLPLYVESLDVDKWLIILKKEEQRKLQKVLQKVLNRLTQSYLYQELIMFCQVSIGIIEYPNDLHHTSEVMNIVDLFYKNLRIDTGNQITYFRDTKFKLLNKLDFQRAINHGEVYYVFQPQMNVETNRLYGLETLIRWNHPVYGEISPNGFIPIAEEKEAISEIGEHTLRYACQQMKRWDLLGLNYGCISINISPIELISHDYVNRIEKIITFYGVQPERLVFEISEKVMYLNLENVVPILQGISRLNIKICLDNFISNTQAFSYLEKLPVHSIKLDRNIINNIEKNDVIAQSVCSLAKALNLQVIALGVERIAQKEKMELLGCTVMQGYLYSKPLKSEGFSKESKKKIV